MLRRQLGTVATSFCVAVCFALGFFFQDVREVVAQGGLPEWFRRPDPGRHGQLKPVETYHQVLQYLKEYYAADLPTDIQLTHAAIAGLLRSLDDPYTRFLDPEAYRQLREENQGEFVGIGAVLDPETTEEGYVRIKRPLPNTPAAAAGVKAGDLISKVDGKSVVGLTVEQVVKRIRGEANTPVRITLIRPGEKNPIELRIIRQPVEYEVVDKVELVDGQFGYISLTQFNEIADAKVERAIRELERQGMKGLILDLRDNPGGMLESAIDISSRFVPPDRTVVVIVEAGGQRDHRRARGNKYLGGKFPLVILVNKGSASASEIVAGAVRDHGVGTIIGTTTFGKGLVQQVVPLTDNSALMVTTAKYLSPKGQEINRSPDYRGGVKPDIEVEITDKDYQNGTDTQLERAIQFLREKTGAAAAR